MAIRTWSSKSEPCLGRCNAALAEPVHRFGRCRAPGLQVVTVLIGNPSLGSPFSTVAESDRSWIGIGVGPTIMHPRLVARHPVFFLGRENHDCTKSQTDPP